MEGKTWKFFPEVKFLDFFIDNVRSKQLLEIYSNLWSKILAGTLLHHIHYPNWT